MRSSPTPTIQEWDTWPSHGRVRIGNSWGIAPSPWGRATLLAMIMGSLPWGTRIVSSSAAGAQFACWARAWPGMVRIE